MIKGEWELNISYQRGDIVSITNTFIENVVSYYICVLPHFSDELVNPKNSEEIYWVEIKDMKPKSMPTTPLAPTVATFPNNIPINFDFSTVNAIDLPYLFGSAPILSTPPPGLYKGKGKRLQQENETFEENLTEEDLIERQKEEKIKRKIKNVEKDISSFKKKRKLEDSTRDLKEQIMLLNVDIETKIFLLEKYDSIQRAGNSDYAKGKAWIKTVLNIPFGKYKPFKVKSSDSYDKINNYFKTVREHLDKKIHKMENVKDEIMEFLARKVSNPYSKGHVLALCGSPGVGKTRILKSLAEALELPFHQINFGGLNDVSVLTGHSETYVGSKPGKFVELLTSSGCMNPIIYLDEIDKISEYKGREINGILTHLLDEEQNNKFQDNYLSNININLSKAFFVIAFNDIEKVDRIVSDRMKVIYINPPNIDDKVVIASNKMIPDILSSLNVKKDKYINLDTELLKYIISSKVPKEDGVRQLRKCLEKIFNKINYLFLTGEYKNNPNLSITSELSSLNDNLSLLNLHPNETVNITKSFIDNCLESTDDNTSYLHMYV